MSSKEVNKTKNTRNYKKNLGPKHCEYCGYSKFVTKHRLKPGRKGGKYVVGNVIILDPTCHAEAECGIIPEEFLRFLLFTRLVREANSMDKEKRIVQSSGLVLIHDPTHYRSNAKGYIAEHILHAESLLGRKILPQERAYRFNQRLVKDSSNRVVDSLWDSVSVQPVITIDETFFDSWSPELAWVLGIIWSSGKVSSNDVHIYSKSTQIIDSIENLLYVNDMGNSKSAHYHLHITSESVVEKLKQYGYDNRDWPYLMPVYLNDDFVRGLYDSGGFVTVVPYHTHTGLKVGMKIPGQLAVDLLNYFRDDLDCSVHLNDDMYLEITESNSIFKFLNTIYLSDIAVTDESKRTQFESWLSGYFKLNLEETLVSCMVMLSEGNTVIDTCARHGLQTWVLYDKLGKLGLLPSDLKKMANTSIPRQTTSKLVEKKD